jgi:GTPase SAR1 family protein
LKTVVTAERQVKVALAGDLSVGKSSLISKICKTNRVYEISHCHFQFEKEKFHFQFIDSQGTEGRTGSILPIVYRGLDVILMCFSYSDPNSLLNLEHWLSQLNKIG